MKFRLFKKLGQMLTRFIHAASSFGVPDGAYLTTRDGAALERELPICRSLSRMLHVLGRAEDGAPQSTMLNIQLQRS